MQTGNKIRLSAMTTIRLGLTLIIGPNRTRLSNTLQLSSTLRCANLLMLQILLSGQLRNLRSLTGNLRRLQLVTIANGSLIMSALSMLIDRRSSPQFTERLEQFCSVHTNPYYVRSHSSGKGTVNIIVK